MLKDHLGNVRTLLTEEQKTIYYPASTLEGTFSPTGSAQANSMINFEKQFYNVDNTKVFDETTIASWPTESVANTKLYYNHNNIPPASPNPNYPAGVSPVQTAGSTKLYKLNASTNKTGLEFIIKVMAGDKIDIFGKSYFLNTSTVNNANSTLLDLATLMTNLLTAPANGIAAKGVTAGQLNTWNTGLVPSTFFRGANGETTTIPKAYINYIFLDEQFKYADGNFSRVGSSGTVKDHWNVDAQLQNITVPKNGYIFVYVSNESNLEVFFDNLQVVHKPGPILEETHYYPFGLTMSGISSKALAFGGAENKKNKFQNQELTDDLGVNYYEFRWRTHDPQIGRFIQCDPIADAFVYNSTYAFSENKVISHIEFEGLEAVRVTGSYILENGGVHPGATTWMPVDNPYNLGEGTLYEYTFWGGEINGKQYKPMQFSYYVPPKQSVISKLKSLFYRIKLPQLIIFGNGNGDFDMGSPIDYTRPVTVFDFGAFQELLELINAGRGREDANPKSDPLDRSLNALNDLRGNIQKNEEYSVIKPVNRHVCLNGCGGSPHDGMNYAIITPNGDTIGTVNWNIITGKKDTVLPKRSSDPSPSPSPVPTPAPKPPKPF